MHKSTSQAKSCKVTVDNFRLRGSCVEKVESASVVGMYRSTGMSVVATPTL